MFLSLFESHWHWLRKSCHPQHMFLDKIALSFPDYQKCFHAMTAQGLYFTANLSLTHTQQTKQTVIKKSPSHTTTNTHTVFTYRRLSLSLHTVKWMPQQIYIIVSQQHNQIVSANAEHPILFPLVSTAHTYTEQSYSGPLTTGGLAIIVQP